MKILLAQTNKIKNDWEFCSVVCLLMWWLVAYTFIFLAIFQDDSLFKDNGLYSVFRIILLFLMEKLGVHFRL